MFYIPIFIEDIFKKLTFLSENSLKQTNLPSILTQLLNHKHCKHCCLSLATLLKKEALAQLFSCKFYEIFKNTFFTELF